MAATAQAVSFAPEPSHPGSASGPQPGEVVEQSTIDQSSSLSSINAQLISHGWAKKPLNLGKLSEKDHANVVTVLFELLGASVNNLNNFDDLAARHRTLSYEHERLSKQHAHSRNTVARCEAETLGWKARCDELEKRFGVEEAKVKELREEVARGRKALEGVRVAAAHETKKTQLKLDKAQAQLQKISNDSSMLSRPQGLTLLNPISGGRSAPSSPAQPVLLETSLRDLAEIRQGLQEETEAFRHVAVSAGNALREALAARDGIDDPPRLLHAQFFAVAANDPMRKSLLHQSASSTAHPTIADAKLKALIADVRKKLVEGVPKALPQTNGMTAQSESGEEVDVEEKKRVEREHERMRVELEEKVKDLQVEIACVRAREEEAQRLVEELAKQQAAERVGRAVSHTPERDDEDYRSLRAQQQKLDEDRRRFAEASARLEHQRQGLEAERDAFDEERRKIQTEAMLARLPPSPALIASSHEAGPSSPRHHHHHHAPSSPSPLSPHKARTPRPVSVSKKRKTPLSRLVLEKAVRQKGKETATALEMERLGASSNVLSEGGRRGNDVKPRPKGRATLGSGLSASSKPPSLGSALGGNTLKASAQLVSSTATMTGGGTSAAPRSTMSSSSGDLREIRKSIQGGRDLNQSEGVGPRAAGKSKVWR